MTALIIYLSDNLKGLYSGEGAYTRMDLYSEVSSISIVLHCCNQAITKPVHIQRVQKRKSNFSML